MEDLQKALDDFSDALGKASMPVNEAGVLLSLWGPVVRAAAALAQAQTLVAEPTSAGNNGTTVPEPVTK